MQTRARTGGVQGKRTEPGRTASPREGEENPPSEILKAQSEAEERENQGRTNSGTKRTGQLWDSQEAGRRDFCSHTPLSDRSSGGCPGHVQSMETSQTCESCHDWGMNHHRTTDQARPSAFSSTPSPRCAPRPATSNGHTAAGVFTCTINKTTPLHTLPPGRGRENK